MRTRAGRRSFVQYLKINYPTIFTIGRFGKWGLTLVRRTFFGITGIAILVLAGLYIAGALIEPARWYLVGIASALLLLGGGLLAVSYIKLQLDGPVHNVSELTKWGPDINRKLWHINRRVSDTNKQVSDIKKALGTVEATLPKMNVSNFTFFQPFNRTLTSKDLKRFAGEWVPKLGLDLDIKALAYMAHHICLAEDTCIGRLDGDIEDMLLRILIARSIKEPELSILKIGTLFGVGMAIVYENCRGFFTSVHITVIDPLRGYHGRPLDPTTMMPVTRDTFARNLERMNIPQSDYTIIERLSTENEAIHQASKNRYNVCIIDGDHSYSGVKDDFLNYGPLVKHGGYILFDNYDDPTCPDVMDFVDKEVVGLPELEFVGAKGITAVFRVVSTNN